MNTIRTAVLFAVLLFPNIGQANIEGACVQNVSLLELQKNSEIYNNTLVRVQGEYLTHYGHHSIAIRDQETGAMLVDIWLDIEDDSDIAKEYRNLGLGDITTLSASGELKNILKDIVWVIPLPVKPLPAEQLKVIRRYWRRGKTKTIYIIVVGRFDYAKKGRIILNKDGQMNFIPGFGNGARWPYRIVAETIVLQKK